MEHYSRPRRPSARQGSHVDKGHSSCPATLGFVKYRDTLTLLSLFGDAPEVTWREQTSFVQVMVRKQLLIATSFQEFERPCKTPSHGSIGSVSVSFTVCNAIFW